MKFLKTVIFTLVLSYTMQSNADIITHDFEAIAVSGTFAGQSAVGSISYDDTNIPALGEAFMGFTGSTLADFEALTAFSFSFLGQNYSQTDDGNFPDLPLFSLFDSFADSLDFFVEDGVGVNILDNRILDFQLFGDFVGGGLRDSTNGFDFEIDLFINERQINTVSAPNIFTLYLLVCGLLMYRNVKS